MSAMRRRRPVLSLLDMNCFAGGTDLNAALVRGGWALSCPRYSRRYLGLEPKTGTVQRAGYRLPDYCVPKRL